MFFGFYLIQVSIIRPAATLLESSLRRPFIRCTAAKPLTPVTQARDGRLPRVAQSSWAKLNRVALRGEGSANSPEVYRPNTRGAQRTPSGSSRPLVISSCHAETIPSSHSQNTHPSPRRISRDRAAVFIVCHSEVVGVTVCHFDGSPTRIGIAKSLSSVFQRYATVPAASSQTSAPASESACAANID